MTSATPKKNFWLWGTWAKRTIKQPFLTQKVPRDIRDVIIGQSFIIALQDDGTLVSWGEDKSGCLGLGTDFLNSSEPRKVAMSSKVVDIQYGKRHILALTIDGRVYSWGDNQGGQLGHNDTQMRYEPVFVEELRQSTVVQILAVDNMSYALTSQGWVYAWGDNAEGALGFDHDNLRVTKPEPMVRMKDTPVKKLAIKECGGVGGGKQGKTVIAFVEYAEPLTAKDQIGGFERPLGEVAAGASTDLAMNENDEKDIFEGVDLMRRIMDNTSDWWEHMIKVRHGSPYDDNPAQDDKAMNRQNPSDNCTALQLDTFVSLDILERASYELDVLIQSAKAQLQEIRNKKGTKNVRFILTLFMDDCKLRREKIRRTVVARQLIDHKRSIQRSSEAVDGGLDKAKLNQANQHLMRTLQRVRNLKTYDVFTRALQDSLTETIECKLQVHETQIECIKAKGGEPSDPAMPALRIIKERWGELKRFSIYQLFQDCCNKSQNLHFGSDEELLAFLVQNSDAKIDQIIQVDRDQMISRDLMIPALCYDLLVENAELRKMCNTYQLKVLLIRRGKDVGGAAALTNG
mmetsp:Transcript_68851/g.180439  ORF Transcript_68851/g.180439 Transcript_68851/m.180439 type:complete len:573 (-) Transcript_68851:184-1902(-)